MTRRESLDELAARAALRPRTGHVLHLGPMRPSVTGSPRVALAGNGTHSGMDAAPSTGVPGLGGAPAQRARHAGGERAA